jgi:hypothetical protein
MRIRRTKYSLKVKSNTTFRHQSRLYEPSEQIMMPKPKQGTVIVTSGMAIVCVARISEGQVIENFEKEYQELFRIQPH